MFTWSVRKSTLCCDVNRCQSSDALGLLIAQSPTRSSGMGISSQACEPLAPEMRAPGAIDLVEAAVPRLQPRLKAGAALVAATIVAAELVVDLPADDAGMIGIVLAHLADDALGEPTIVRVGKAIVTAAAPDGPRAVGLLRQRLRIFLRQPGGHDRRRRADDDLHVVLLGQFEPAIEPAEVELAFARLEQHPGKLGDADDVEARVLHHLQIGFPALLGPMFGIVVDADVHVVAAGQQNTCRPSIPRRRPNRRRRSPHTDTKCKIVFINVPAWNSTRRRMKSGRNQYE